jgi:phytanoyl-CoA hydroxylase
MSIQLDENVASKPKLLSQDQCECYRENGYVLVRGLMPESLVAEMIDHLMHLRKRGKLPGDYGGTQEDQTDPNHQYPRMLNPHKWDKLSAQWSKSSLLMSLAGEILGEPAALIGSMVYFKPPGAKGFGMHQDQQSLAIDPLTIFWIALEPADTGVGCMVVMPKSHKSGILPVQRGDVADSFVRVQSVIPEGLEEVPIEMMAGDVLLMDGKVLHGSYRNKHPHRWRRSLICQYTSRNFRVIQHAPGYHMTHVDPQYGF